MPMATLGTLIRVLSFFLVRKIIMSEKRDILSSIYIYDGSFEKGDAGYPLIRLAAARYAGEKGLPYAFPEAEICREERGKPYFTDIPLEFSLSHSGQMWMCMISEKPCGLDLQQIRDCDAERIAARQYTPEERHYVDLWGIDGFFSVWVRKEAFVKCTGQGLFTDMPSTVNADAELYRQVEWKGKRYFFTDIEIGPQLKCAVCTEDEKETKIEMRLL